MLLKADLHVHTETSYDSRTTLKAAVAAAKAAGLDFVAVTDHNEPPPEEVFAWEDPQLLLIPGVEYSTDQGHLLGLFLERPVPRFAGGRIPVAEAAEAIHQSGGIAVLAHPFQSTAQTEQERFAVLRELEPLLDGLEIGNRRASKKRKDANLLAREAADRFQKPCVRTAGSDAHLPEEVGTAFLSLECKEKTVAALRTALEAGAPAQVTCPPCRNRFIAESQKIKLQKAGAGPSQWGKWVLFRALCAWRDLRQKKG